MDNLVHYSNSPVGTLEMRQQEPPTSEYTKPNGFWVSVDDGWGWRDWCLAEGFNLENLTHVHDVKLAKNANVLVITNSTELDKFTAKYSTEIRRTLLPSGHLWRQMGINWPLVASEWRGIIITPYVRARRLHEGTSWYYGWDCSSGCIWDPAAIASITLREVVPVPEPIET